MTSTSRPQICARCDQPIAAGRAVKLETPFSASGARPDDYAHPYGDPDCATGPPWRRPWKRGRRV
jgi:hypothetical protein